MTLSYVVKLKTPEKRRTATLETLDEAMEMANKWWRELIDTNQFVQIRIEQRHKD